MRAYGWGMFEAFRAEHADLRHDAASPRVMPGRVAAGHTHMCATLCEQVEVLSTLTSEKLAPADDPIRRIKAIVDRALAELGADFAAMDSRVGRPGIAPQRLLGAWLLIAIQRRAASAGSQAAARPDAPA
jgi:hypothetical protein